tara:strand:- start:14074 stop:14904 length:831 start_codon:yes stop_codon:yes gene_type:complete
MIKCEALNKDFSTKEELFAALKENKSDIISLKKAQVQKSFEKGSSVKSRMLDISKQLETIKNLTLTADCYYIVVNTTNILDSHMDVHLKGIWNKTVQDQKGKNYLIVDHKLEVEKVVVRKEHVEMIIAEIPFSAIGKSYDGNTQALIYKVPKDKVKNEFIKEWLESKDEIEASVRMQYVKIELAMNSDNVNDKIEKANYDTYINEIANKDDFEEINYFFIVQEAKNITESSLVVAASNSSTGIMNYKQEPSDDTLAIKDAAAKALRTKEYFINLNS